ncbi:MAG TPA: hypothetical protein PLJ47_06490 [Candidatus Hydrogenedentes bacterium]|nr:hypothetical protein [Candidatus Hydrogenedentota bacterium]HRK34226.1 hypothetical protein [Candidatus Hydrogenedentota bacterium]
MFFMRIAVPALVLMLTASSCQSDGGGSVVEKVKYDFGIGEKPEGYESVSDRIMARLDAVGKTEMRRMNVEGRHGTIEFQQESELQGKYYKQVKQYESYQALEAVPVSRGSQGERGFVGYIQFTYRMLQSERKSNRTEAEAQSATIRTDVVNRETYRYTFGPGGTWDGKPGEATSR